MISSGVGKDATAMFNGGVYRHSNAAHNLLSTMRVAVVRGGMPVDIWRRAAQEDKETVFKTADGQRISRAGEQPTKIEEPLAIANAA